MKRLAQATMQGQLQIREHALANHEGRHAGVLCILMCGFLMALQDTIVKALSPSLPLAQIFAIRSGLSLLVIAAAAAITGTLHRLVPRPLGAAFLRAGAVVVVNIVIYALIPIFPLAMIASVAYTAPIFIAAGGAVIFREAFGWREIAAVLLGFAGVLAIVRPGGAAFSVWSVLPLVAALGLAAAALLARGRLRHVRPLAMLVVIHLAFLITALVLEVAAAFAPASAGPPSLPGFLARSWVTPSLEIMGLLILLSIATSGMHLFLVRAYQIGPTTQVAAFDYAYLVFVAGLAWALFGEMPKAAGFAGMAAIVVAGFLVIGRQNAERRACA